MKKRIFRKFNVLAAVPLIFALAVMIAPINAFAFDIGGPTAQAWVDAGTPDAGAEDET